MARGEVPVIAEIPVKATPFRRDETKRASPSRDAI
jgi:hypothetical protein